LIMQLGLGTAQFGFDYGISNVRGRSSENEIRKILAMAARKNVAVIDTAAAYGEAESVLGRCLPKGDEFRIVTKTIPLRECSATGDGARWVRDGFFRSLKRLGVEAVDSLLIHHVDDLLGPSGPEVYDEIFRLKQDGKVRRMGISAYSGSELDEALNRYDIDIVQVPLNVLDQRLLSGGQLQRLKEREVEIHVRSVFLQGLLLMDPWSVPSYFEPIRPSLLAWHQALKDRQMTPAQGAFAFAQSVNVDVILVGVENAVQLQGNIADFGRARTEELDFSAFALNEESYLNPSRWKLAA
jgi:aryl-alcohol dehydrogenase-like predicted oxidoreductase